MRNKQKSWYKPKGYLHFSPKLRDDHKAFVESYIEQKLECRNFFPLIHETLVTRRFKAYLNENNEIFRSHFNPIKKKPSKKPREIFYANHLDAHIYAFFSNELLGKKYEKELEKDEDLNNAIIAYRKIPIDKTIRRKKNAIFILLKKYLMKLKNGKIVLLFVMTLNSFFLL